MKRLSFLVPAVAVLASMAGLASATSASGGPQRGDRSSVVATERRSAALLDVLSAQDLAGLTRMLHPDITWSVPLAVSGDNATSSTLTGRDAVMANFTEIHQLLRTVRFLDRQISVVSSGATSFVEARGEFETAAGAPYRNVYVIRLDWRAGKIIRGVEYTNPVTICLAFPLLPGCPPR